MGDGTGWQWCFWQRGKGIQRREVSKTYYCNSCHLPGVPHCTLHLHSGCKKTLNQGSTGMISIAAADGGDGRCGEKTWCIQVKIFKFDWKRRKKWSKFKNTTFFNHGFQPNSHPKFAPSSLRHWDTCGNTAASSDFTWRGGPGVFRSLDELDPLCWWNMPQRMKSNTPKGSSCIIYHHVWCISCQVFHFPNHFPHQSV